MRISRALAFISVTACALSGAFVAGPAQAAVDNHLSLVSVATPEVFPGVNGSFTQAISDDGRFVLFVSSQPNIVVGDEADPAGRYLYLRDLQSGTTTRLSHGPGGYPGGYLHSNAAISADGGYVVYASDEGDGQSALRLYNRSTGTATVISAPPAGDHWYTVAISDDARYVFYTRTEKAGELWATKLYRYDVQTGVTDRPVPGKIGSLGQPQYATVPSSSADGRYLTFVQSLAPAEEYSTYRVVRLDTSTGIKTVLAKSSQVTSSAWNAFGDPSMSNDGRYIAYMKQNSGGVRVFLYDANTGVSQVISHAAGSPGTKANGGAYRPQISGNGRYITFQSNATNIVAGLPAVETVYVYDRQSATAEAIVKNRNGVYPASGGGFSSYPFIDGDGSTVAFASRAQNLTIGANNRLERVYVWQRP